MTTIDNSSPQDTQLLEDLLRKTGIYEEFQHLLFFIKRKGMYDMYLQQINIELKSNEELIQFFLEEKNYSDLTKKGYLSDFKYTLDKLNNKNLQQITSKDIYQFQQDLKKNDEYGIERKKRLNASLRSFYKFYRRITKIFDGEFYFIEFPEFEEIHFKEKSAKKRSNKDIVLTLKETYDFLYRMKLYSEKDYLMTLLMVGSGMRIGDVINTEIDNVDLVKRKIRTRTKSGIREYHLSEFMKKELLRYLPKRTKKFLESPYLFIDGDGNRLKNNSYTRQFIRIIRKKLHYHKGISCHSLRRTFSTIRKKLGQQKDEISFLLGHTIKNVTDNYIKLSEEEKLAIYDQFDF
ncbi:MAG: tyrosine-type recombinase/integrase [Promethearchaeota archaeon]